MKIAGKTRAAALLLVVAVLVAGCAKSADTTTPGGATTQSPVVTSTAATTKATSAAPATSAKPTAAPAAAAPAGPYGDLKIAENSFGNEKFNPMTTFGSAGPRLFGPMGDFLFWMETRGGQLLPGVVEKWEMAADAQSWTLNIRRGIKFHNGDDLTGKDVKFSIEQFTKSDSYYADIRDGVSRVDLVDDYTVRIFTKGKRPYLLKSMSLATPHQGEVVPKDYIEKNGWAAFEQKPVGSGPFRFVRYLPGDMVESEALDKHWRQTPAFKRLVVILIPEEATRVAALKTGEVDIIGNIGFENTAQLVAGGNQSVTLDLSTSMVLLHGVFDPRAAKLPTSDIRVRQALSLAINRNEIIKTFYKGLAEFPMVPSLSGPQEGVDAKYWQDYANRIYRYDVAEATRLLKEAGYAGGFNIKLYTFDATAAPDNPKLAQIVQAFWAQLGVKVDIVATDQAAWTTLRNKPVKDPIVGQAATFGMWTLPPANLSSHWYSRGGNVLLGDAFPEFDKLVDSMNTEMDARKSQEYLAQALKIAADAYSTLNVARFPLVGIAGPRVGKIDFPTPLPLAVLPVHAAFYKHSAVK